MNKTLIASNEPKEVEEASKDMEELDKEPLDDLKDADNEMKPAANNVKVQQHDHTDRDGDIEQGALDIKGTVNDLKDNEKNNDDQGATVGKALADDLTDKKGMVGQEANTDVEAPAADDLKDRENSIGHEKPSVISIINPFYNGVEPINNLTTKRDTKVDQEVLNDSNHQNALDDKKKSSDCQDIYLDTEDRKKEAPEIKGAFNEVSENKLGMDSHEDTESCEMSQTPADNDSSEEHNDRPKLSEAPFEPDEESEADSHVVKSEDVKPGGEAVKENVDDDISEETDDKIRRDFLTRYMH